MTRNLPPQSAAHGTLYRLSLYTVILAWIILGLYFYAVARPDHSSADRIIQYFLPLEQFGIDFSTIILFAPFTLTVVSYLIYDRAKQFSKTIHAEGQLRVLRDDLIVAFANALDAKSSWTRGHSQRVTGYALMIAKELNVSQEDRETLRMASLLHDVGKIGTDDGILDKPGPLTEEEWRMVRMHPSKGEEILEPIKQLQHVIPIIKYHHERIDGKGYPEGLAGKEIPLLAKILCLADAYDAMIADRPYQKGMSRSEAFEEIKKKTETQFDPVVAAAFLNVMDGRNRPSAR